MLREFNMYSDYLQKEMYITVYIPPYYYDINIPRPVIYMLDGQNLFRDDHSQFGSWGLEKRCDDLFFYNSINPPLIVGIHNDEDRNSDYSPCKTWVVSEPVNIDNFADFIMKELKPFIECVFKILPGAKHCAIAGASAGAMVAWELGIKHQDIFGTLGSFSCSYWWNNHHLKSQITITHLEPETKIFMSCGKYENIKNEAWHIRKELGVSPSFVIHNEIRQLLWSKKIDIDNLKYVVSDSKHNEAAWGKRFYDFLKLFYSLEK